MSNTVVTGGIKKHSQRYRDTRPVGSSIATHRATFTRPANVTAYADGDAVGETIELTGVAPADTCVYLLGAYIQTDNDSSTAVYRAHFYNSAPVAFADNAAVNVPRLAERETYLGNVTFPALDKIGSTSEAFCQLSQTATPFPLPLSDGNLYVVLEVTGADTPTSGQEFAFTFIIDTNS